MSARVPLRSLRIALIASSRHAIREPFAGGMEVHTWQLARGLRDRGHDILLFAGPGSDVGTDIEHLAVLPLELSEAARADVSMVPATWLAAHHAYLQVMLGLGRGDFGDVDVVHNNSLHHLPVAMAASILPPMVTTLHTPPTPWLESAIALSSPGRLHFAAVSRATQQAWRHVTGSTVVQNGVDTNVWQPGPGGSAAVWCGRIVPEKAPHLAIRIARAAGVPLRLAGPIADQEYFREVVMPSLDSDARYVGHLDHASLRELVAHSAAALVTPAWEEPYGLVVAEALACGTPVCAFARGGIPELIRDPWGRLIPEDDIPTAAAGLLETIGLDRRDVRRAAVEHLSVERMLDGYEALYGRAVMEMVAA